MAAPNNNDIDLGLIRRALSGDQSAYTELYNSYRPSLVRFFGSRGVTVGDAEDLVQTSFISAFRALPRFRSDSRFSTWLYRIAFNAFLMRCRDKRRLSRDEKMTQSVDQPVDPSDGADGVRIEIGCLDRSLRAVGDRLDVARHLPLLPPCYRQAIELHLRGYTHDEICQITGHSMGNSKSMLSRARVKMRVMMMRGVPKKHLDKISRPVLP